VTVVPVPLGERSYDVVVGPGARHELAAVVAAAVPRASRAVVVTQEGIGVDVDAGLPTERLTVPDGESAKSLTVVEELCRSFARAGLSRSDVVVAVGGGVVTDLAGFAAASFHRGTPYVNVATTLLAQVDAAIGGKTGVNLPEGKNLVGAFWQPAAVLCDTDVLATLPPREWASGRGEMAKYAFLGEADGSGPDGSDLDGSDLLERPLPDQVAHCVAIKAAVVAADEREGDRRMVLNYGHTLAHALEASAFEPGSPVDLRHGEAVAVGLEFAALLARRLGRIGDEGVAAHRRVLHAFDLSGSLPEGVDPATLVSFMARDKKAHHDLTFVLDGPAGVEVVRGVGTPEVLATLEEMRSPGSEAP
jgi:5-deoxy-5-amino-3-dehydroquinate synthase